MTSPREVTQLLQAWHNGDQTALNELMPLVYDELRRLAAQKMARESAWQTLDATGLVHEAYLRLVGPLTAWESRERAPTATGLTPGLG